MVYVPACFNLFKSSNFSNVQKMNGCIFRDVRWIGTFLSRVRDPILQSQCCFRKWKPWHLTFCYIHYIDINGVSFSGCHGTTSIGDDKNIIDTFMWPSHDKGTVNCLWHHATDRKWTLYRRPNTFSDWKISIVEAFCYIHLVTGPTYYAIGIGLASHKLWVGIGFASHRRKTITFSNDD